MKAVNVAVKESFFNALWAKMKNVFNVEKGRMTFRIGKFAFALIWRENTVGFSVLWDEKELLGSSISLKGLKTVKEKIQALCDWIKGLFEKKEKELGKVAQNAISEAREEMQAEEAKVVEVVEELHVSPACAALLIHKGNQLKK